MTSAGIITPIVCNTDTCDAGSCLIGSAQRRHERGNGIAMLLVGCMGCCYRVLMVHQKMIQLSTSLSPPQLTAYKALVLLQIRI